MGIEQIDKILSRTDATDLALYQEAVRVANLTNEILLADNKRLRAALGDMLFFFDKPKRDEWMNEAAWNEAKQICVNAHAALNRQKS